MKQQSSSTGGGVYYCWDDQSKKQICLIYMYLHPIQIQPFFFIPMENSLRDSLLKKRIFIELLSTRKFSFLQQKLNPDLEFVLF